MTNKLNAIASRNKRVSFKDLAVVAALVFGIGLSGYSVANAHQPVKQDDGQTMTAQVNAPANDCSL